MHFHSLYLLVLSFASAKAFTETPQQIHLSLGVNSTQMMVTWVTQQPLSGPPCVAYGVGRLDTKSFGRSNRFVDGGQQKRHFYVHRVLIADLRPSLSYQYRCGGDDDVWSAVHRFRTHPPGADWSPRLAIFGDLGLANAQSVPRLERDVRRGMYDAVLHVGDMAYNLHSDNARVGDQFMRLIEPIAASVAYQVCPGNHEHKYNFSNFDNRFSMIDATTGHVNNHFYAFNLGRAHVISLSTEFYYYPQYGWHQIGRQFEWLVDDLRAANEARAERPWIITMAHKPLYCMTDDKLCSKMSDKSDAFQRRRLRKGVRPNGKSGHRQYGLESLFYKYGVDIELYGHEHNYQRLFPVFDNQVCNGSTAQPYRNPKAPVVVVTGSAGCAEYHAKFRKSVPEWSAFRSTDYGFTRMTVHNKTHVTLEQVSDSQGNIIDMFVIIKDNH